MCDVLITHHVYKSFHFLNSKYKNIKLKLVDFKIEGMWKYKGVILTKGGGDRVIVRCI